MPQGSALSIANLKIESGALATPWRAGLAEIEATANEALAKAEGAENVGEWGDLYTGTINHWGW